MQNTSRLVGKLRHNLLQWHSDRLPQATEVVCLCFAIVVHRDGQNAPLPPTGVPAALQFTTLVR